MAGSSIRGGKLMTSVQDGGRPSRKPPTERGLEPNLRGGAVSVIALYLCWWMAVQQGHAQILVRG